MATITPLMVGATSDAPAPNLQLSLTYNGNAVASNQVDLSHVNQILGFTVTDLSCGNSCWGNITVEYKLAPRIQCPPNDTLPCAAIDDLPLPSASAQCGQSSFEVFLLNEERVALDCDDDYTHIVTRTYRAVADIGEPVDCRQTIHVERLEIDSIRFPQNLSVSCDDPNLIFNSDGFPYPWISDNVMTGSGSVGVPYICLPSPLTGSGSGLGFPLTGSGSAGFFHPLCGPGNTLIPIVPQFDTTTVIDTSGQVIIVDPLDASYCNASITYTDVIMPSGPCVRKAVRTWEIREWWCSGEETRVGFHTIEVKDTTPPSIVCPADFTVSSLDDCSVLVDFPSISATDQCNNEVIVSIDPEGFPLINSNGGTGMLIAGDNKVTYNVRDVCHNRTSCDMTITVQDRVEPVAICERDIVVSISPSGGTFLSAQSLDDGSWDGCGIDSMRVRRMTSECNSQDLEFGETVEICCMDAGSEIMVIFRVYDTSGNFNDCMVRVTAQDKTTPSIACPDRDTIDCRTSYDINNLSLTFGEATAMTQCAASNTIQEEVTPDLNQCGKGKIERKFTMLSPDGIALVSCQQVICIVDSMLFDASMIIWPEDLALTTGTCSIADADPEDLGIPYGTPRFTSGDDQCSLLGFNYTDQVLTGSGSGGCFIIERTWSVINWCDQSQGAFARFNDPNGPQIISSQGNTAPTINDLSDINVGTNNLDCTSGLLSISQSASDDCNTNNLVWSFVLLDSSLDTVSSGATDNFETILSVGQYVIHWRVSDGCGHTTFGAQNVIVSNNKPPSPVCLTNLVFPLDAANDELELWASDFDGGSQQICGNPFSVSIGPDVNNTTITYTCDSIGMREVRLYVTDNVTGNQDFCVSNITITDEGSCPTNRVSIQGDIVTEELQKVYEVEVHLDDISMQMTDVSGNYAFGEMPMGGSYTIRPYKNDDYLNGVSTLDLVLIQKHILGQEIFDSPYDIIASDVNNDEQITSVDLVELRKLILGIYDELPENMSWRFVDKDYRFADENNPWSRDISETYSILHLDSDMDIDFVGVKIGDVNGSVVANLNETQIDQRQHRWPVVFEMEDMKLSDGIEYRIPVYGKNYERVTGFQGTINFDNSQVASLAIEDGSLLLDQENYYLDADRGIMTFSYHGNAVDISENTILFELVIKTDKSEELSDLISLGSNFTRSEAYRGHHEIVNIEFDFKSQGGIDIVKAKPNPWKNNTTIEFEIVQPGLVEWEIYDAKGQLVFKSAGSFESGKNTIPLRENDLGEAGMYFIKMKTAEYTDDYKIILLK